MLGPKDLVLCCGTVAKADLRGLVAAASAGGFQAISLWPQLYDGARAQGLSDADIRHMLSDHGLEIAEHDALLSWLPGADLPDGGNDLGSALLRRSADDFFRIAEAVGGRSLNVAQAMPSGLAVDAAADALVPVCQGAAKVGLQVSLEFLPWSDIPDPATGLAVVEACAQPNLGLMVDAWHVFRGPGEMAALRALPGSCVVGTQLCDAPAEPSTPGPLEALTARLLPGEGAIDLVDLVRALDAIGSRAPMGVEVYSDVLAAQDPVGVGRMAGEAARAILSRARAA